MRPIKLSMTAFGPFVDTEVIDFEALGDKPLFLINGPTGSGKTTLLDAICFALYGQTTGKEREASHMRCDYATDKTLTEVEFIFELAGKHYRILRVPEQERAKSKGVGTTRQAAKAELWQFDGDEAHLLVARKVSDATHEIEQLTGLQVDQFRQVMVLPQGQFRRLLMADSKDRELIFSQLFETHSFKKLEDKLFFLAKAIASKVAKLKENQQGILQSVELQDSAQLEDAIDTLKPLCKAASGKKRAKEKHYLTLQKSLQTAKQLAQDFIDLKKQELKKQKLEQQLGQVNKKRKKVERAEAALKIETVFNDWSRCTDELKTASNRLEISEKKQIESQQLLKLAEQALQKNSERSGRLEKNKKELSNLQAYLARVVSLQEAQEALKQSTEQFKSGQTQLIRNKQLLRESIQALDKSEQQKQALETELQKHTTLDSQLQKSADQLEQKLQYEQLLTQRTVLGPEIEKMLVQGKLLAADLEKKQNQSKQLELLWHNAQASILASELQQNHACPVCGSLDHPEPAHAAQQPPSEQERVQAQKIVDQAQQAVVEARESYAGLNSKQNVLQQQIYEHKKRLGGIAERAIDELKQEHQALVEQLNKHKVSEQQLKSLNKKILKLKLQEKAARESVENANHIQAELNANLQVSKATVKSAEKELPEEYRLAGKLEKRIKQTEKTISQLEQSIQDALQSHANARQLETEAKTRLQNDKDVLKKSQNKLEQAKSSWQKALQKSLFDDNLDYQNAQCSESSLQALKTEILNYDQEYQKLSGALEQQKLALKGSEKPDISALKTQLELARQEKNKIEEQWKQLNSQLSHLEKAHNTLEKIAIEQQKQEDEYKVIGTLSNVASGKIGNKISLQRFVLGVLLDDVLVDASRRLKIMSKGRYLLLRKEDRAKGNKASGLELEVEDSYTGKVRPVSTLSGGESFMASLSLALGLSDVVQAYAGGIRLDTLFIDEGFGSLDADSLDLAIRTLIDLRNTGRMVGIISHVSELKEQIGLRLDVLSGRCGSTIRLVN